MMTRTDLDTKEFFVSVSMPDYVEPPKSEPLPFSHSRNAVLIETSPAYVVNDYGGRQAFISADFSSVPPKCLRLLAQCLGFGSRKYGKDNAGKIPIEDHLSHAMNHINEFRTGDTSEPHLVNALARITMALSQAVENGSQPENYVHPDMIGKSS